MNYKNGITNKNNDKQEIIDTNSNKYWKWPIN